VDLLAIASFLVGGGLVLAIGVVVVIVARRRGLDQVDDRADASVARTLDAQDRRIALQEFEIAHMKSQVAALQQQVASLTADLHASDAEVRRLSRLQAAGACLSPWHGTDGGTPDDPDSRR